ncbi:hypothetical protein ASPZODRAFT_143957 [Penicilliopsis zonata CBS 506.65]|uniref:MmgE/PrpD family protein n=1 Tax=Penicilliopsis zonata CBS 506.65 TaxID=1073090 RepID=A0A1L9SDP0_9EURO|nr:hypothetical protein ASPZODRAFT_143957 [Penicilliopsis zonata CBS 506.65]OJJ45316.1 hypothetical protein ASPZODRAFT_143957 [Penicilliopsis zonata CBS 506.65]
MESATEELCHWISNLKLADIPPEQVTRAKYLVLDGLACALIGAQLPWSQDAVHGVLSMEAGGACEIIGWERRIGPLSAALLNSTFIQGFELDDYHRDAPIHSNAIVLPILLAVLEHNGSAAEETPYQSPTGAEFLLAAIAGYETGPRVGLGVYGVEVLSRGWHSGAIFGPAAAAAAATKLLGLSATQTEEAMGMACTQAGGLMAAQYESNVKRMQHGFAARNGLFAALMARSGYTGIKRVLERPYGGFLSTFSLGNGREPRYRPERVVEALGSSWEMDRIVVKPYASMAATHSTIDGLIALQVRHPGEMKDVNRIRRITIEMSEPAFKKGGWKPEKPLTPTGAQMTAVYAAAMQLLDGQVQPAQFAPAQLERVEVWELMERIVCVHNPALDTYQQRIHVEIGLDDETVALTTLTQFVDAPRGNKIPLSNEEILDKWRVVTAGVITAHRRAAIEEIVLNLDTEQDVRPLAELLYGRTEDIFS